MGELKKRSLLRAVPHQAKQQIENLRNCLARSVWWDGMSFSSLSLLPAAVMGAAAPWAPPKGRQTRGEKDMKFNQTSTAGKGKGAKWRLRKRASWWKENKWNLFEWNQCGMTKANERCPKRFHPRGKWSQSNSNWLLARWSAAINGIGWICFYGWPPGPTQTQFHFQWNCWALRNSTHPSNTSNNQRHLIDWLSLIGFGWLLRHSSFLFIHSLNQNSKRWMNFDGEWREEIQCFLFGCWLVKLIDEQKDIITVIVNVTSSATNSRLLTMS